MGHFPNISVLTKNKERYNTLVRGLTMDWDNYKIFMIKGGIPSGPGGLFKFKVLIWSKTSWSEISMISHDFRRYFIFIQRVVRFLSPSLGENHKTISNH